MEKYHSVPTDLDSSSSIKAPLKRSLKDKEASIYIGMSSSWLRHSRIEGAGSGRLQGPQFIKVGRCVRYLIEDLDLWLEKFQKLDHLAQQYLNK
jgi:hypothetical protein